MTTNIEFSIGILSWKGYDSLTNSLLSYQKNGLSKLTKNKFICLPEYSEEGIKIAKKFGYKPILIESNIGILDGFKKLAEAMPEGPLLLLENDLELVETSEIAYNQLKKSLEFLKRYDLIQIRLRSKSNPGDPFVALNKYKKYWSDSYLSKFLRLVRPFKANKLIGTAAYILDNPEIRHPKKIKKLEEGFFLVQSSVMNWANLAILVDRNKYLKIIIDKAERTSVDKKINGFKNIEIELNNLWWRKQNFKILITPGLFTHKRLSHRGY